MSFHAPQVKTLPPGVPIFPFSHTLQSGLQPSAPAYFSTFKGDTVYEEGKSWKLFIEDPTRALESWLGSLQKPSFAGKPASPWKGQA